MSPADGLCLYHPIPLMSCAHQKHVYGCATFMRGNVSTDSAAWREGVFVYVQDERMQDMMVDLRGKFKAICARLGLPEQIQVAAVGLTQEVAVRPSYDF